MFVLYLLVSSLGYFLKKVLWVVFGFGGHDYIIDCMVCGCFFVLLVEHTSQHQWMNCPHKA